MNSPVGWRARAPWTKLFIVVALLLGAALSALYLPKFIRERNARSRGTECAQNLAVLWDAVQAHAAASSNGNFPALAGKAGVLMFDAISPPIQVSAGQYPFVCLDDVPDDIQKAKSLKPDTPTASSYSYLGYALSSEAELEAFAAVYEERLRAGLAFDDDLDVPVGKGSFGGDKFLRFGPKVDTIIRERPERASQVPVIWDQFTIAPSMPGMEILLCNHMPGGANVLFLDGRIAFCKYPREWPVTKAAAKALTKMQELAQEQ